MTKSYCKAKCWLAQSRKEDFKIKEGRIDILNVMMQLHRPSKLWPGVRRTVTVAVFLNVWNVANEFCTTIGSFFFFSSSFTIDSKWKNRYSVRDILCPFLASRKINSFRLALFLYNPDPWRPRKLRLVSHELASTRILTNIIYESQRNRRRKKRLKKNDGKRRKKNGRCCCVSLEKEKGLLLLELCVGEEEDVCFFSPHPKFRLEETLFRRH